MKSINNRELEFLICDLARMIRALHTRHGKSFNIDTNERRALIFIHHLPGLTQRDLAEKMEMECQNITRILDRMLLKKWLLKKNHPLDRRANCLFLTQIGTDKITEMLKKVDHDYLKLLQNIDPISLPNLTNQLKSLENNFNSFLKK